MRKRQKDALYAWENGWRDWNVNNLSLTVCRAIVHRACRMFKITPPRVRQHLSTALSWCDTDKGIISFQAHGVKTPVVGETTGGKNRAIALHEAAHYIVHQFFGDRIADHGPTFLGVYLWLLAEWRVAPVIALHVSARKAGLRWRHLSPAKLRSRQPL